MNKLMLAVLSAAVLVTSAAQAVRECRTEKCRAERAKQPKHENCKRCGKMMHPTHRNRCMCPKACATETLHRCEVACPVGSEEESRIPATQPDGCDKVKCIKMVEKEVKPCVTKTKKVVNTCGTKGGKAMTKKSSNRYSRQ